jgi:uncharacterized membrane protein YoaK (UPF0700 family)
MKKQPGYLAFIIGLLSIAAGFTDAFVYLHAKVFPANMTGNSVVLAIALGKGDLATGYLAGLALLGFIAGTTLGSIILYRRGAAPEWTRSTNMVMVTEIGIYLALTGLLIASPNADKARMVIGAAVAMGLQGAATSQLSVKGISTIVITGTLSLAITRLIFREMNASQGKPLREYNPLLQFASWIAYLLGALLGGAFVKMTSIFPFAVPLSLILFSVLCGWRQERGYERPYQNRG